MNIAILMCGPAVEAGGGVRIQGLMWHKGLTALGHKVDLISFWKVYKWEIYDAIIILQFNGYFWGAIQQISQHNPNIILAPILDPKPWNSKLKIKIMAKYFRKLERFNLTSDYIRLYKGKKYCKAFLTRSQFETDYLSDCFDIPKEKIRIVPLSLRFNPLTEMPPKEDFCFHVSRLASENKNVHRLIEAAIKYNFNLKLAGALHGKKEQSWLKNLICDAPNIEYLGEISDMQLIDYYKRAKVFALPSTVEGVGMVALEAAGHGCDIVLTNLGAPKDYFQGRAELVNPFSVTEIGEAIVRCLKYGKSQPDLLGYIADNYSLDACSRMLESALFS